MGEFIQLITYFIKTWTTFNAFFFAAGQPLVTNCHFMKTNKTKILL